MQPPAGLLMACPRRLRPTGGAAEITTQVGQAVAFLGWPSVSPALDQPSRGGLGRCAELARVRLVILGPRVVPPPQGHQHPA